MATPVNAPGRVQPAIRRRDTGGVGGRGQGGNLIGAGKKIAAPSQLASARGTVPLSARSNRPEQPLPSARGGRSGTTSPSQASEATAASGRHLDAEENLQAEAPLADDAGAATPNMLDLAKGGESLLRRLADVSSANLELRRQLEVQSSEIAALEDSGKVQQKLLREFERRVEQSTAAAESKVRAEAAEHEARLRSESEESLEKARQEKEEVLERLHACESERAQREAERDEALAKVSSLEARLNAITASGVGAPGVPQDAPVVFNQAPVINVEAAPEGARQAALEMELSLVKQRFAKEVSVRQAAEKAAADSQYEWKRVRGELERTAAEVRQLRRELAKQAEQVSFAQECSQDLQAQLRQQQEASEQRLNRERGRFAAVNRLEGVLPKHVLMKALG